MDELPLLGAQAAIGANMLVDMQGELKELRALVTQQAATIQQALCSTIPLGSEARTAAGGGA